MTVAELRKQLADKPDHAVVAIRGNSRISYFYAIVEVEQTTIDAALSDGKLDCVVLYEGGLV